MYDVFGIISTYVLFVPNLFIYILYGSCNFNLVLLQWQWRYSILFYANKTQKLTKCSGFYETIETRLDDFAYMKFIIEGGILHLAFWKI